MTEKRIRHKSFADVRGQEQLLSPMTVLEVYPSDGALLEARDRVRALTGNGDHVPAGGVLVLLHEGDYRFPDTLLFDRRDSGKECSPIIWRAAEGERVLFDGADILSREDFRPVPSDDPFYRRFPDPGRVVVFDSASDGSYLPSMDSGFGEGYGDKDNILCAQRENNAWPELFRDEKVLPVARFPRSGWLISESCEDPEENGRKTHSFRCSDPRLQTIAELRGTFYHGYPSYDWAFACAPISDSDRSSGTMTLGRITHKVQNGKRFYLSRVPEALSEPGDYLIRPDIGRIYLIFPEEEGTLRLSRLCGSLVRCEEASHLWFEGIEFGYARGSGAVVMKGCDVRFSGCRMHSLGYNAVRFGRQESPGSHETDNIANGGYDHLVRSCDLYDIGFGAVYISAGNREELKNCNITVENCDIHNFSRTGKCYCFGVYLTSTGARIRNNRFHDGVHSAVWFDGNENVLEYNEFYDLLKESDDAAAVYCGRDYTMGGNIIRWNFFHDMCSDAKTGVSIFGTYCDDNSASLVIYGNLYYHMQGAHHSHGGHDITIENNLIVDGFPNSVHSITFCRYCFPDTLKPGGLHDRLWKRAPVDSPLWRMRYPHKQEYFSWDPDRDGCCPHYCSTSNNVIIRHEPVHPNFDWETPGYANRLEKNPVFDFDPGFVDEAAMDLRLREDSPVYEKMPDFRPIPFEKMGLYRDIYRRTED